MLYYVNGDEGLARPWHKKLLLMSMASLYAYVILYLPILTSKDSSSYYAYADIAIVELFRAFEGGIVGGLLREPAWLLLMSAVSYVFAWNHDFILLFLSYFSSFVVAYTAFGKIKGVLDAMIILLLLSCGFFIGNFVTHLREGIALAIFLMGLNTRTPVIRILILSITPFIHVAFFIILSMYYYSTFLSRLKASKGVMSFAAFAGMVTMSVGVNAILRGDTIRQSSIDQSVSSSGLGFLYWLIYLFAIIFIEFIYKKRPYTVISLMSLFVITFYLTNYYYFYATARILEVGLFFVAISAVDARYAEKYFFITYVYLFVFSGWLFRLNMHNLGY